ncbi:MotA/TolQ/ExbB proton channel family protein [Lutibacter oceani]|uniref:MotA/TolQ/ExbB proton channel family protein n=1 Tax=Lutibacter oceani TaxID=1853311 RepID=A0A3D9RV83_9FLAO|nr:MotA/TolQ/ExbB proton channel family protein [Lutibacter oceani]REE80552.1 MotA/TolQ/ExbB proton channel family protein [Lutibacter oceani]
MTQFFDRLNEGGPLFMYTIFFVLILIIALTIKGILNRKNDNSKTISLISQFGLFIIAWGFLGQTIGLISAFDAVQAAGDISPAMVAGGLKVALLTTVFGLFTFVVSRIGIIILTILKK